MNWAYIAGYFDGEGSVGFYASSARRRTTFLAWYNTNLCSLEAMQTFMGVGSITARKPRANQLGKLQQYILQISNKADIIVAIDAMSPFLIIKRDRAIALRRHLVENVDETRMVNFGLAVGTSTEDLTRMYVTERMSISEVAKAIGVTQSAVSRELRARGIDVRPAASTKGQPKSEETRRRMKESRRRLWQDPTFRAKQFGGGRAGP